MEYPRSFVLGGKKNLQGGKGKGIRGERGGGGGETGEKTEGRNGKEKKKKKKGEGVNRTAVARIDLAQESNALPVTYCDSQVLLRTVLDFYCDSDL